MRMTPVEVLGPLDASFLYVEDGTTHMHIAACAVFEGPPPSYAEVAAAVAAKLGRIPRYRQVVRFVPLQLGRPVLVDDPDFSLGYHLRRATLPAPGGREELRALMGRVMSQELDRRRPLWESWLVDGMEGGRWALISKVHHCLVDGVAGTDLLTVLLDAAPDAPLEEVVPWAPGERPSGLRLAAEALVRLARNPYEQARAARRMVTAPGRAARQSRDLAAGLASYLRRMAPTGQSSFVGSIGPDRRWTWVTAELADLKAVRRAFGGTVNDVILAAVAAGIRDLLVGRGEEVDHLVVRSLVPVSVREEAERGTYNNRVSAIFAELPVSLPGSRQRLAAVCRQMEDLKASHQVDAGRGLVSLGEVAPFLTVAALERAAMRVLRRVPQLSINTVTTNVPGPQFPLYLLGREMVEYLPFVPIAPGVRVGVAIVSYNGKVTFGITGDHDTTPDLEVMAGGIDRDLGRLRALAARRRRPGRAA